MSKIAIISKWMSRGFVGNCRMLVMVMAALLLTVATQAQYTGGNGGGGSSQQGSQDYCTPVIGAKVVTTCSGVNFSVSPTDGVDGDFVPASTTYSWLAPTGVASITGLTGASGAAFFSATLTNTSNTPITVTYTVTPASLSCTGASFTVTVTVNPTASVTQINLTTCSGVSFAVTPSAGVIPTGVSYT
ncbi:MAG: PKD-like domain-containing protein, partial [Sediminibacterium sp.]